MHLKPRLHIPDGAHDRNRTDDLLLTMEMLYRLSYVGMLYGSHHIRQHSA